MTPREAAKRLRRAEAEYRASQEEHDGTGRSTVRYQAAKRELEIAFAIARAVLIEAEPATVRGEQTWRGTPRHESARRLG